MKNFKLYSVLAVVLVVLTGATAAAAPNIFGLTGYLEMPNDITLAPGQVSLGYTYGFDAFGGDDANFFTGVVGVARGLELGVGFADPDNQDSATLLNAKWRFVTECGNVPSVSVGVVDALADLDIEDDDPGFYILISKTLTRVAEEVTEEESKPLRGHIGFGTGIYDGLMAALNWQYKARWQVVLEYVGGGLNDNDVNGLVRYAISPELRFDVGLIDFDSLTLGINYTTKRF